MTARARFTKADIRRVMIAAQEAGYDKPRVIIYPSGQIEIVSGKTSQASANDEGDFDL